MGKSLGRERIPNDPGLGHNREVPFGARRGQAAPLTLSCRDVCTGAASAAAGVGRHLQMDSVEMVGRLRTRTGTCTSAHARICAGGGPDSPPTLQVGARGANQVSCTGSASESESRTRPAGDRLPLRGPSSSGLTWGLWRSRGSPHGPEELGEAVVQTARGKSFWEQPSSPRMGQGALWGAGTCPASVRGIRLPSATRNRRPPPTSCTNQTRGTFLCSPRKAGFPPAEPLLMQRLSLCSSDTGSSHGLADALHGGQDGTPLLRAPLRTHLRTACALHSGSDRHDPQALLNHSPHPIRVTGALPPACTSLLGAV